MRWSIAWVALTFLCGACLNRVSMGTVDSGCSAPNGTVIEGCPPVFIGPGWCDGGPPSDCCLAPAVACPGWCAIDDGTQVVPCDGGSSSSGGSSGGNPGGASTSGGTSSGGSSGGGTGTTGSSRGGASTGSSTGGSSGGALCLCSGGPCDCPEGLTVCCPPDAGPICTNFETDPLNCGSCGAVCSSGVCDTGICGANTFPFCDGPQGPECDLCDSEGCPNICCGTTCVSTLVDSSNCGACGNQCQSGQTCNGGQCVCDPTACSQIFTCDTHDFVCCGNSCVDIQNDSANCGGCGSVCAPDQSCQPGPVDGGVCVQACALDGGATSCAAGQVCCFWEAGGPAPGSGGEASGYECQEDTQSCPLNITGCG
jgi:hypothetical protein